MFSIESLNAIHAQAMDAMYEHDAVLSHMDRTWRYFRMNPPSEAVAVAWRLYALHAAVIIQTLPQGPERTLALRGLLESRSQLTLIAHDANEAAQAAPRGSE